VRDDWQRRGLGTELLRRIVDVARRERVASVGATMLPDNQAMMRIASRLGFEIRCEPGDAEATALLRLDVAPAR
jgi:acetyltransferase